MILSVVIPAHNEEGCIEGTVRELAAHLSDESIPFEIIVVNDSSQDATEGILKHLAGAIAGMRYINNTPPNGFGFAVRAGLEDARGDCVAIYMADASDRPQDLVRFYRELVERDVDCVFGSRFMSGGKTIDYPLPKLILNRAANTFIQALFGLGYNDITNAFKLYRTDVLHGLKPLMSHHFNLTVELPLKAIVRGYTYTVLPNHWINRKRGISKLKIREMGSRYLFIVLYCFIEKWLSRGDYHRVRQSRRKPTTTRRASKKKRPTSARKDKPVRVIA
jgi:dolichol-phosphate mannosyltransferase